VAEKPSLEGVARDASTLLDVLRGFAEAGYEGSFQVMPGGKVRCLHCRAEMPAAELDAAALRRLEGASDPADMLAAIALTSPRCGTRGVLVVNYGPEAMIDDADVLRALEHPPPPGAVIEV